MNDMIAYRPYQVHRWLGLFMALYVPIFFAIAVWCFVEADWGLGLSFAAMSVMFAVGMVISYNTSKIEVVFDRQGVKTFGKKDRNPLCVGWESLPYAYYSYYRGHSFLLLSPNSLDKKRARRFASRGSYAGKVCIDGVWVIYMNAHKDVASIKELVTSHVENVITC